MKLLIVTQVMDKNHPILGFFHRWVEEFAKNCEQVLVICLEEGEHSLPDNVTVYSLGKDKKKASTFLYLWRLNKISWQLRSEYDDVFVHMNPEYVLAGFPAWKILNKKIGLWYTHGSVSRNLRLAEKIIFKIFTAAKEGSNIQSDKVFVTGHGIDTDKFTHLDIPQDIDLVTIGRISPAKNFEALVDMLALVRAQHDVSLTFIGKPMSDADVAYKQRVIDHASKLGVLDSVKFMGSIAHDELPKILSRSRVFVHAATNGSLDKALLEPLAVGIPVITMAKGAQSLPLGNWLVADTTELALRVSEVLQSDVSTRTNKLQLYIKENHSIGTLIPKICQTYYT
jgi:glycosyltransferase involved in cell wall biosynthesis